MRANLFDDAAVRGPMGEWETGTLGHRESGREIWQSYEVKGVKGQTETTLLLLVVNCCFLSPKERRLINPSSQIC